MNIYTSYFGNARNLAKANVVPVGISLGRFRYLKCDYLQYLAPKGSMLRSDITREEYIERYTKEVLDKVNIEQFRKDVEMLSKGGDPCAEIGSHDIALLCYEKPGEFCHRRLFADWMKEKTGYEIKEFGYKDSTIKVEQKTLF